MLSRQPGGVQRAGRGGGREARAAAEAQRREHRQGAWQKVFCMDKSSGTHLWEQRCPAGIVEDGAHPALAQVEHRGGGGGEGGAQPGLRAKAGRGGGVRGQCRAGRTPLPHSPSLLEVTPRPCSRRRRERRRPVHPSPFGRAQGGSGRRAASSGRRQRLHWAQAATESNTASKHRKQMIPTVHMIPVGSVGH